MGQKTHNFRRSLLARSVLIACGATASVLAVQPAFAQDAGAKLQRVEITGSSIKRLAAESALPMTSIKAEDFAKQGLTTAQEVMNTIPMNQTSSVSSTSVGSGTGGKSTVNLRGIGGDKTLVLLNGRRLANHPINADSVDLNIIPVSALDRIEILRDGASAIYGTDAIGGVINFITKRSVSGFNVAAELVAPEKTGAAESRVNFSGGVGDLDEDGYNFFGVVDMHKQDRLKSTDRDFSKTGVILDKGLNLTSGTPFPANFFSDKGIGGNPSFAGGCQLPYSLPRASNKTCRFDYTQAIDNIPLTEQQSFLGKASFKLNASSTASLEYLYSKSTNESKVAPPPLAGIGLIMKSSSPYYPGGSAGVPAVAGLTGEDLDVSWRPVGSAGQRVGQDESISNRLVAGLDGFIADWDYRTAFTISESKASSAFAGGYVSDQKMVEGVGSGLLNPFGPQTAAGTAFINAAVLKGKYLEATMNSSAVDFKASRDLMDLPAGPLGFAVGGEFRSDKADYRIDRALASQASSSGYSDAKDQSGDRTISAVFAEVNVPIIKDLEVNVAARYDNYSDVGNTFNPKVGIRYQPVKEVLVRGSYNTGFRAPTLYDLNAPQTTTNTANTWDDPVLCPGGKAVAGANPNLVCDQQQNIQQGGNKNLKPETSNTYSVGIVIEPTPAFTASVDLWQISLKDQINAIDESTIFGDYAKYKDRFVYSADGKSLQYIVALQSNLGKVNTNGADISLAWRMPKTSVGNFVATLDGTYVDVYEYQNEKDGPFTQNAGSYQDNAPVMRWRHNAAIQWTSGDWSTSFAQKYVSGYTDQNQVADKYVQDVKAYVTYSLSATYSGIKNASITAGVKNLFDEIPPFSNQGTVFQKGYDPRFTDPVGRAFYVRANYKFK
jgi:iron complex outermembrane receptor protein